MIVREKSGLLDGTLADLRKKSPVQFLACSVLRNNELIVPRGEFAFNVGDKAAFMVKSADVYRFLKTIGVTQKQGRFVMLLGASETAYYLTKMLCASGYSVKIIEKDPVRCAEMAAKLPFGAHMILGDGSSQDLLNEEGIASADAFVALTGKDEENILISFYAQSQQVKKVVSKVSHGELSLLAEKLGLDCLISPMKIVADVLTRYARALNDSMHILRAEMPGPSVDKIVPRASTAAKILYLIYMGMTVLQTVMLALGGMPLFDAIVNSFSTAGTGGFAPRGDSMASYNSYCQWVTAIFMLLYSVNFNLYFLMLVGKFRAALSSGELWLYLGIVVFSSVTISADIFNNLAFCEALPDAIRHAVYQTATFITTTGSSTIPSGYTINDFPAYSKAVLLLLMFVGGCAGSTAGGLKVSRIGILARIVRKELRKVIHPRSANAVKYEGKVLTEEAMAGVTNYFALYMVITAVLLIIVSIDGASGLTLEANLSAVVSCLNNVGPAYGINALGYYNYSDFTKLVLSFAMLLGRLEIYPILLTFAPSTWF